MRIRSPKKAGPGDAELAAAWQVASLLLGYPDGGLLERRPLLRRAVAGLPASAATPLGRFLDHLDATPLRQLEADYVATFDHRKRCCLYLSYYAYGDTRKRGMALLRFKQAYEAAG
ncbi:nitrate reductase molybdenum cofactor assembly chaperone, partial [Actinomadura sp. 7K507]|uniref:nitrate reductase molybdenum cofactor assembly chaperone n=1 Tax=Actinomadura sp. 7K507 TaxID=2530365 RepID=UPI001FB72C2C